MVLHGVKIRQPVEAVKDLKVFRLGLDAKAVEIGDALLQRRTSLDPARLPSDTKDLNPEVFQDLWWNEPPEVEIPVTLDASAQFSAVFDDR